MEKILTLAIPALLGLLWIRALLLPLGTLWRIGVHSGSGFLCLWLLNLVSGVTGIVLPVNGATVLIAGFLGLPGIGLIALLELKPM